MDNEKKKETSNEKKNCRECRKEHLSTYYLMYREVIYEYCSL